MKKLIYLSFSVLAMSLLMSSCSKDSDSAEKFSTLSVEENKAIVEDAGISFVQVLDRMRSLQTVDAMAKLADVVSSSGSKGVQYFRDSKAFSVLQALTLMTKGTEQVNNVFKAIIDCKSDEPESIQQFWDDNTGTYTWNPNLNDFDIVLGGSKFIFKFPSSDVATTNDAVLTISNYSGVNISNPLDEDYSGDLPAAVNMDLKVGTTTLVTFVFGADYNTDGIPNAIAADLTIEGFKFEVDVTNNTKVVSVNYKFLEGTDVIMNLSTTGNGLFTEDNYNNNTITHSETYEYISDYVWNPATQQWDPVYSSWTDEWKETDFEEILKSASAQFQLFNIALKGDIDVKGLVDNLKLIDNDLENENIDDETAMAQYAEKVNKYLNLRLVNITGNLVMAKVEAYVVHDVDYYYDDYYISFRLTFNDGSPIDLETYFNNGFDSFVAEINNLLNDINSDYDLNLEPIDY